MATQAQIAANRRNARRSTGPTTAAGKARVARNAVRHGLRSKQPVQPDPDDAEFRELLSYWESSLEPTNDLERDAVLRLSLALWRRNRVAELEVELLSKADHDSLPGTMGYLGRLIDDASRAVIRAIERSDDIRRLSFNLPQLPEKTASPEQTQSWPARRCQKRPVVQTNPIPPPPDPAPTPSAPAPPPPTFPVHPRSYTASSSPAATDACTMIPDMKHTRREFAAASAITLVPRHVLGGANYKAPSDTLNLAGIGVGGMGKNYLKGVDSQNIVALCDVDDKEAAPVYETYPDAKTYRDYRVLLEKEKGIDGVVIGTPDHTHAVIMMAAFKLGKHVYCAKPLTRTIAESRAIRDAAREAKVATQMSVQSCASDASLNTAEWVRSGAIGKVREVHVWSDRPVWPQGLFRPRNGQPVPSTLDWDLWLGPAKDRPFSEAYHPFKFRGWYDFGTGALGDMGCHTFHVIVRALELGDPTTVSATHADVIRPRQPDEEEHWSGSKRVQFPEAYPHASIVTWQFPRRRNLPPVSLTWYDGGLKPSCPPDWAPGETLPAGGILFKGSKGTLFSGFSGKPQLLPASRNATFRPPKKKLERTIGHYDEWIEACKGGPAAKCEFDFGTYLTELTLLGNLAVRTGLQLKWDPINARTDSDDANQFLDDPARSGWGL